MSTEAHKENRFDEMERLAILYADAKADRVRLEHFRKSKKAMLMKEAEEANPGMSAALQDREARRHPDYLEVIKGLSVATGKEEAAKWRLLAIKFRFEHWRTLQANERAEMNLR